MAIRTTCNCVARASTGALRIAETNQTYVERIVAHCASSFAFAATAAT